MTTVVQGFILKSDATAYSTPPTVQLRQVVPQAVENTISQDALLLPGVSTYSTNAGGFLSVSLFSESDGTAYEFRIQSVDTDTGWIPVILYDGADRTWGDLLPTDIPQVRPDLDRSVARVAQQISSDVTVSSLLRGSIGLTARGEYVNTQVYRQGDLVTYQGASYTPLLPTPIVGIAPTVTASWQLVAARGVPGGTGGNNAPYDSIAWSADPVNAPTRQAVRNKFADVDAELALRLRRIGEVLQTVEGQVNFTDTITVQDDVNVLGGDVIVPNSRSVVAFAAPRVNPQFSGFVDVPLRPDTDNNAAAASTSWVRTRIANEFLSRRNQDLKLRALLRQTSVFYPQLTGGSLAISPSNASTWEFEYDPNNLVSIVTPASGGVLQFNGAILTQLGNPSNLLVRIKTAFEGISTNGAVQNSTWNSSALQLRNGAAAFGTLVNQVSPVLATTGLLAIQGNAEWMGTISSSNWNLGVQIRHTIGSQGSSAGVSYSGTVLWDITVENFS